ncbi:uncharacterized protein TNCV_2549441 [Trichonephila clavipes]|nr:uncharacterized protein TNCV_2549441 [Trichonephila clavipes]
MCRLRKSKKNMQAQNVCDVRRITIRRDGQVLNTKHLILTFNTPDLPQTVKMAYIRCPVRPYIPNPAAMLSVPEIWTFKNSLRGQPTCSRCAEVGHDSADCKAKERCVNCKGDHSSFSRSCPTWLLEKEITALKIKNKISYPEARRVVSSRTPVAGKSYASATSKSYVSTAIQVDASAAPTSATAASIKPKNVAVDTLKSVSPPRDVKKNRKTRIKDSGCNPHKKKRSNLSKNSMTWGDDVMDIHPCPSQSAQSLMDDLSPRPRSSGSWREHVRRLDDLLYLLELPWSKDSTC